MPAFFAIMLSTILRSWNTRLWRCLERWFNNIIYCALWIEYLLISTLGLPAVPPIDCFQLKLIRFLRGFTSCQNICQLRSQCSMHHDGGTSGRITCDPRWSLLWVLVYYFDDNDFFSVESKSCICIGNRAGFWTGVLLLVSLNEIAWPPARLRGRPCSAAHICLRLKMNLVLFFLKWIPNRDRILCKQVTGLTILLSSRITEAS